MPRINTGPKLAIRRRSKTQSLFYITWSEGGRSKRHATGIPAADPDAGQAYFQQWLRQARRARRSGPSDPAETRLADVIEDYVTEHGPDVVSSETLAVCARPLMHFFHADTIASMTPARVKAYWQWRRNHGVKVLDKATGRIEIVERSIADGTVIRELAGTLRPAIRHAIEQRRLAPGVYYVPVPSAPRGREYWITRDEAARLLRETRRDPRCRLHLPLYVLIALYTGQRRGAILDLQWRQIDFLSGVIDFSPPGRAQTRKRRSRIPIPRSLFAALRRAHKRSSSPFVIAYQGEPVKDVKTAFNSAAERAGIPDCTSHTLRHTAGTWMAQRGVPIRQIAGWLAHSEQRTTELYAHHHPSFMQEARAAMERQR